MKWAIVRNGLRSGTDCSKSLFKVDAASRIVYTSVANEDELHGGDT